MVLMKILALCLVCQAVCTRNYVYSTLHKTLAKLKSKFQQFEQQKVDLIRRSLVIFHIGDLGLAVNSLDIAINNLKIFLGAIEKHSKTSYQRAFYLFNVVDELNPLVGMIPITRSNVAMMRWTRASSDLEIHLRTLDVLGKNVTDRFGTIVFGNQGLRGPLTNRDGGEWLGEFQRLLNENNVVLTGPTISCEMTPHVQTHMFAIRSSVVPLILADMDSKLAAPYKTWKELVSSLEVGMTKVVQSAGYNISSLLYQSRGQPYFTACLQYHGPPNRHDVNPTGWCGVSAEDLMFVKWGGEPMRTPGMVCNSSLAHMEKLLEQLALTEPQLNLIVPEVMMGGPLYPLFKEYAHEAWIDRHPPTPPSNAAIATATTAAAAQDTSTKPVPSDKVCFIVRVLKASPYEDMAHENANSQLLNKGLEMLITTLRRQNNPNWHAYLVCIDTEPSEVRIMDLLQRFDDPRLELVSTSVEPPRDAHLTSEVYSSDWASLATDAALKWALQRQDCQWISVTNSDNAYGSQVVENVFKQPETGPGLVFCPTDSHRFRAKDLWRRQRLMVETASGPDEPCAMLPALKRTSLSYGLRPTPHLGGADISSAFILRQRWLQERLFFDAFTDPARYPCGAATQFLDPVGYECLSNAGAYLIDHLVHRRLWSYTRLPIDGLRSVVFQGNSPTLCIGSGNVWVDHADPAQQYCVTPADAWAIGAQAVGEESLLGTCLRPRKDAQEPEQAAVHSVSLSERRTRLMKWFSEWWAPFSSSDPGASL